MGSNFSTTNKLNLVAPTLFKIQVGQTKGYKKITSHTQKYKSSTV